MLVSGYCGMAGVQAAPSTPELPVIFYGQVSPSTPASDPSAVTITLTGNSA